MSAACASIVTPSDGTAPLDGSAFDGRSSDGSEDGGHADVGYRRCSETGVSTDCVWCVGAATDAHDGLCAPNDVNASLPESNSTCLVETLAAFCFAGQMPGSDACFRCVPLDFCVTTFQTGRDIGFHETDYCRHGDGTHVTTGVIPPGNCPNGSSGLLCGNGCAPCTGGMGCWGPSEVSGLGACVLPDSVNCKPNTNPCHSGFQCLMPTTMSADPFDPGFCVAADRCQRIAAQAPLRFTCAP